LKENPQLHASFTCFSDERISPLDCNVDGLFRKHVQAMSRRSYSLLGVKPTSLWRQAPSADEQETHRSYRTVSAVLRHKFFSALERSWLRFQYQNCRATHVRLTDIVNQSMCSHLRKPNVEQCHNIATRRHFSIWTKAALHTLRLARDAMKRADGGN
jgi:hypothetical protein